MVRWKQFILIILILIISPISQLYAVEIKDFIAVYKIKDNKGEIFYIGWIPRGVAIKYKKDKNFKIIINFDKEEITVNSDEYESKNIEEHTEIEEESLVFSYSYANKYLSYQSVKCRFVNNGYWLDLICRGSYSGGSSVPFYKNWIITYDGRVLSLKEQEKFIKEHNVMYDTKSLKKKFKSICLLYGGKKCDEFKADSVRIGVDTEGNAILGFVFTETPAIYGVSYAETKSLIGETIWIKAFRELLSNKLESFLLHRGFTLSTGFSSGRPDPTVFWWEFSFSLPTFYCRKIFSLVIASIFNIEENFKNINCLYLSSKEEKIRQLFHTKEIFNILKTNYKIERCSLKKKNCPLL